jgi:hypothetical protein
MVLLFGVAYVTESFGFHAYHYWKIFLIFVVFFFNKSNGAITIVKLYFSYFNIIYGVDDFK